jgi:hypothetical protein
MKRLITILILAISMLGTIHQVYATTCANAVVIPAAPALPYVSALTCGTTNDITSANSTTCGSSSYKGGWEAVYVWTPSSSYNDVSFAYSGVTWTGIFLYQGCPTSGGICIGNFTSSSSAKTLAYVGTNMTTGTKISLSGGVTYYIVIDTYPTPNSPCPGTLTINGLVLDLCSGTPDPGNTISSSNPACPGLNFTLSLQNATSGSGVTYQWQSSPNGADPWTNIGTSTSTHVASQLVSTYYRCQVTCLDNTGTSNPLQVQVYSNLNTYPFVESFNNESFPPTCWLNQKTAGTGIGLWERVTAGTYPTCSPHSGAGMTKFNCFGYTGGTKGILVSMAMDLPNDDYLVSFWFHRDGSGYLTTADLVNIYYNTNPGLSGATLLGTVNRSIQLSPVVETAGWYEYVFNFPAGSGGNSRYVIFEGVSAYGNNIYMDDVKVSGPAGLEGYVFDYDGNPVVGATVTRVGGLSTTSGAGGYFLLTPLSAGSQQFTCTKAGYNAVMQTIDIPEETILMYDFTLLKPQIATEPETVFAILTSTESTTANLLITNDGDGLLDWQAVEVSGGACDYTVELTDSYGDGWNGGKLDVLVNGSVVLNDITLLSGYGPLSFTFAITTGDQITTVFTAGSYAYECAYRIYNNNMTQVWLSQGASGPPNILPGQLLGACDVSWLSLDNYSGQVDPFGGYQNVSVTLDASATPPVDAPGVTYTADILFTSPSGIESKTVPVTLVVTDGGIKGPQELALYVMDETAGKFLLKWKYFTIRGMQFDHFAIVRNGELYATSDVITFNEVITEPGNYCYKIYAVYENGAFSDASNEICITYPLAPGVPLANWALLFGALLIGTYAFFMIRRRS